MEFIVEYKDDSLKFEHCPNATSLNETQFIDRCWFIVKNKNHANVEAYADLWLAWKYHGATYASDIMKTIQEMEKNVWDC